MKTFLSFPSYLTCFVKKYENELNELLNDERTDSELKIVERAMPRLTSV